MSIAPEPLANMDSEASRGLKRKHKDGDKEKKKSKKRKEKHATKVNGVTEQRMAIDDGAAEINEVAQNPSTNWPKKPKKSHSDKAGSRRQERNYAESPFSQVRASMYISIPPILQGNAHQAVCANQLSSLLGLWYPHLKGTILAYNNVTFPGQTSTKGGIDQDGDSVEHILAESIGEAAMPQLWISADFLVFQPRVGSVMEGYVNIQEDGFISLVVYNWFSASISKRRLPKDWQWVEDEASEEDGDSESVPQTSPQKKRRRWRGEGSWMTAEGVKITNLGPIEFRVLDVAPPFVRDDKDRQIMGITGTLLSAEEEAALALEEQEALARLSSRRSESIAAAPRGILKNWHPEQATQKGGKVHTDSESDEG